MFKKFIIFFCLILFTVSCSYKPVIHSHYNPELHFGQYKTFGFYKPLDKDDNRYQSLISQYLQEAVVIEMTKRGFVFDEADPDLLINFHTNVEAKQVIRQIPSPRYYGYYGYRSRYYYDVWPSYEMIVDNYEEGTLNIDVVDKKLKKMVWEGIAVGRLNEESRQNPRATIQRIVPEVFIKFPLSVSTTLQ